MCLKVLIYTQAHTCVHACGGQRGSSNFLGVLMDWPTHQTLFASPSPVLWWQARALSLLPHVINKPSSVVMPARCFTDHAISPAQSVCAHKITSAWSCVEFLKSEMCPISWNEHSFLHLFYSTFRFLYVSSVFRLFPLHHLPIPPVSPPHDLSSSRPLKFTTSCSLIIIGTCGWEWL